MATTVLNDFERERELRIEENRRRMSQMGIAALAAKIQAEPVAPPVRQASKPALG